MKPVLNDLHSTLKHRSRVLVQIAQELTAVSIWGGSLRGAIFKYQCGCFFSFFPSLGVIDFRTQ